MRRLTPLAAARNATPARPGHPASAILHNSADARVIVFHLQPGEAVPVHTSPATVLLEVLEGTCTLSGADGEATCTAGTLVVYDPDEPHGMRADHGVPAVLLATIAPIMRC